MKRTLGIALAGLLYLTITEQSQASTFELGTLVHGNSSIVGTVQNLGGGIVSFDDTIRFSLSEPLELIAGSVTEQIGVGAGASSFRVELFANRNPTISLGSFSDPQGFFLGFVYFNLAAGGYFLNVSGQTHDPGLGYQYTFNLGNPIPGGDVVPLPPALLLFGTAFGALGVMTFFKNMIGGNVAS